MKYYEPDRRESSSSEPSKKLLCRTENFVPYSPVLNEILNGTKLTGMCSELFNEKCIMYKDKINYKYPGSDGFLPHQDIAAGWWMYNQSIHISCLISIDATNKKNGCLEVVSGTHLNGMLNDPFKEIPSSICENLEWQLLETEPGDICFFDSFVPHQSKKK